MKILVFGASLRKESFNKKLASQIADLLKEKWQIDVDHADFNEFEMPLMNEDLEAKSGIPEGAKKLITKIQNADAIIISTPEYNKGIPGPLKNAIDWVSRFRPNPLNNKPVLLTGATPGTLGTFQGLWHVRVPIAALGAQVHGGVFGLSNAQEAFDANKQLSKKEDLANLINTLENFVQFSKKLTSRT